jgi:two-component system, sensor histidine kinase and response regulator
MGMSSLLVQTSLDAEQREYVDTIHTSATMLLTVINDILDLSSLDAGKMSLADEPFSPRVTLAESARVLAVAAAARSIELVVDIDPDVPQKIRGDSGRIRQMILNLAGNAVKFTERGEVVISVSVARRDTDSILLQFSVRDTGIGIPVGEIDRLFQPFQQIDSSETRRHKGTGLGLVITRRLAEQMRGKAWAESVPGQGSTFSFTAEFGQIELDAPAAGMQLRGRRIGVIHENAAARFAIERMLVAHGAEARSFPDWNAAETLCGTSSKVFDEVIVEDRAGSMTAVERVERVLSAGVFPDRILMLLAPQRLHDALRELAPLGVGRYLLKPVSEERLIAAIDRQGSVPAAPVKAEKNAPRPLRVLVAEDNLINQRVITKFLGGDGHDVVVTNDGEEAVAAFQRQSFDVVLMDIQMPVMDGFAATAAIRSLESHLDLHTPIIALTAHSSDGDRQRCRSANMDGYLTKPLDRIELRRALAGVTALRATA